jgi:hypothetical protein
MKRITSQVAIGGSIVESAANTFTEATIHIPLSPVDRQGFVIQECYIMSLEPLPVAGLASSMNVRVTKSSQDAITTLVNPMLVSAQEKICYFTGASSDMFQTDMLVGPTSEGQADYITILATTDAFIQIQGLNNPVPLEASVRLVGYYAELTSDEYNALVLDELQ